MYQGKRMNPKSAAGMKRKLTLLASVLLVLSVSIGATVAYLMDNTEDVKNTFTPAEVPPTIVETFPKEAKVKENVKVKNMGNVDAYVRAAVVINWQKDGDILPDVPVENTDYTITYDLANGWSKGTDGYYYWNKSVAPNGGETGILITKAEQKKYIGEKELVIEILAQTIQSVPTSVVVEKWGVTVADDGTISK